jgi:integrase
MASVYRPAGRHIYRIEFKDQHGQHQKVVSGMTDRRAAEGLASLIERDVDRLRAGLQPENPNITGKFLGLEQTPVPETLLADLIDRYLADLQRQGMSPATLKHPKKQLNFLSRTYCWKRLKDITTARVTAALAAMTQAGRSVATTNAYRDTLNAFLGWCIHQEYLTENPVRKVRPAKGGVARPRRRRAFAPAELRQFLTANPDYADYYLTAALTGLRLHELSLVERRDFNLEKGIWTCRAEVDKMNTVHQLPIVKDLLPTLQRVCRDLAPTDRLFPEQQSNATFNRHLAKAKLEKISADGRRLNFHSLRYTFCALLAGNAPLKFVQRMMRHASLKHTADLYLQLELESLLDQAFELPPVFNPDAPSGEKAP